MGGQGGEYEPRDSRNVTGTSANPTGDRWSKAARDGRPPDAAGDTDGGENEITFDPDPVLEQQVTGGESAFLYNADTGFADEIAEHMQVVGSDGEHVGTVDGVEGERIKLTRAESGTDTDGGHRFLPIELVAAVEGDMVRLSTSAAQARQRVTAG